MLNDGIARFSVKADNYNKYRPRYPSEIIDYIKALLSPTEDIVLADIGSGTAIFTKQILPFCKKVYGIEPNEKMRKIAENSLIDNSKFISINGKAESTTLKSNSIDFITVSQAFHWFEKQKCKLEFKRILKPNRFVILLWNKYENFDQPFLSEFDRILIEYGEGYKNKPTKINIDEINSFFHNGEYTSYKCNNPYLMDFQHLLGTLLSCSYIKELDEHVKKNLESSVRLLYSKYQDKGKILFLYESVLYYGKI